jgi:hypothetical protein
MNHYIRSINNLILSMNSTIETRCSVLHFEEPDLLRSISKPGLEMDIDGILENIEASKQLTGDRKYYVIIITEETATYTKEAREYKDASVESRKKAEAIVVTSLPNRILGTFYARSRRKNHPIRLFATEAEALEWIESLRARELGQ